MELVYEMGKQYLVAKGENPLREHFLVKMIQYNQLDHILMMECRVMDGICYYYYEITNLIPLSQWLGLETWGKNELSQIMESIYRVAVMGRDYLYSEEEMILNPEYIFVDEKEELWIGILPGQCIPFAKGLESLLQMVMEKMNHKDRELMFFVYGLYGICKEQKRGYEFLKKYLEENGNIQQPIIKKEHILPKTPIVTARPTYDSDTRERVIQGAKEQAPTLMNQIRNKVNKFFGNKEPELVRETEGIVYSDETVLLRREEKPVGVLLESKQGGESIAINHYPFVIGKDKEHVDYMLSHQGVSHIHCRFQNMGGKIFLVDEGSKNGTYHNEMEIVPYEPSPVKAGDEVQIGVLKYQVKDIEPMNASL